VYPWDSLLIESTALGALLPQLHSLWHSPAAQTAPLPLVAFAFRLLLVRLLVGFGKLKFTGTTRFDALYIKTFLVIQPLLSPLGWYAFALAPDWVWRMSLSVMWFIEMPLPLAAFLPGLPRLIAAGGIASLMAGIQATGNFGYFNLLTAVLCIPLLDATSTLLPAIVADTVRPLLAPASVWPFSTVASASTAAAAAAAAPGAAALLPSSVVNTWICVILLPLAVVSFAFNSWVNLGWAWFPGWRRALAGVSSPATRTAVQFLLDWVRWWAPFRLVAAYGVFPPNAMPPARWACIFETSQDGAVWSRLEWRWFVSTDHTAPAWVAPFHPRIDHAVFYLGMGMSNRRGAGCGVGGRCCEWAVVTNAFTPSSSSSAPPLCSDWAAMLGNGNPYLITPLGMLRRLQLRLLDPATHGTFAGALFRSPSSGGGVAPRFVRVRLWQFTPSTAPGTLFQRGAPWWQSRCVAELLPPASLGWDGKAGSDSASVKPAAGGDARTAWWQAGTPGGPESLWADAAVSLREMGLSRLTPRHQPTGQDVDDAWKWVAAVRSLAADAAEVQADALEAGAGVQPLPAGPVPPSRVAAQAVTRRRLLPTPAALRAAAGEARRWAVDDALPVWVINVLFSFANLPWVTQRLQHTHTVAHRLAVLRTVQALSWPLWRALDALGYDSPPLAAASATAGSGSSQSTVDAIAGQLAERWPSMAGWDGTAGSSGRYTVATHGFDLTPPAEECRPVTITPLGAAAGDTNAVAWIADNDDGSVGGALRSHFRQHVFGLWWMLAAGRRAHGVTTSACARRQPGAPLTAEMQSLLVRSFTTLPPASPTASLDACLHPGTMATEAGVFLLATLEPDTLAHHAISAQFSRLMSRPTPSPDPAFLPVAPGWLEVLPRVALHPTLITLVGAGATGTPMWAEDHGAGASSPSAADGACPFMHWRFAGAAVGDGDGAAKGVVVRRVTPLTDWQWDDCGNWVASPAELVTVGVTPRKRK